MEKEKPQVNITNNFNAPIGQHINHVDNVYFSMDGDGTFHFGQVEQLSTVPRAEGEKKGAFGDVPAEWVERALKAAAPLMWGNSAFAVLFCELRDHHQYPNNMSQFERDADALARRLKLAKTCPEQTLIKAFHHNKYLLSDVDTWETRGASTRAMKLLRKLQEML